MAKPRTQTMTDLDSDIPNGPPVATCPPPSHREDPLLTFKEVAVQIGVDESTIARWSRQMGRKRLRTVRMPSGRRKVRQSVVDAILQACADDSEPTEEIKQEA